MTVSTIYLWNGFLYTGTGGASPDATVNVTGVQGTGAVGSVIPSQVPGVAGVAGAGAAGSVAPAESVVCTGVSGTGGCGTGLVEIDTPVTGVTGAGAIGSVISSETSVCTGVSGAGACATGTIEIDISVSGVVASGAVGTVTVVAVDGVVGDTATPSGIEATGSVGFPSVSTSSPSTLVRDDSIGRFKWPRAKTVKGGKPVQIDWHAIEERRSAALKSAVTELFFPKPIIAADPTVVTGETRAIAELFAAREALPPTDYYELELLMLLA